MASSTVSDAHPDPPQIHADLQDVAHEVHREFAHRLDPGQVGECLDRVAANFDDAKVRSFVPLLVRLYVREELHASLGHAWTWPEHTGGRRSSRSLSARSIRVMGFGRPEAP